MRKLLLRIIISCSLLLSATLFSSENLLSNADFSKGMTGWYASSYPHEIKTDTFVADIPNGADQFSIVLTQKIALDPGKDYLLSYTLETENGGVMRQVYQMGEAPWKALGLNANTAVTPGKSSYSIAFRAIPTDWSGSSRITFNLSRLSGRVSLSDLKLTETAEVDFSLSPTWTLFAGVRPPSSYSAIPEVLSGQSEKYVEPQVVSLTNDRLDVRSYSSNKFVPRESVAVLYNSFESPLDGSMAIGVSADWDIEVYINGIAVFSGTGYRDYSVDDNLIKIPVKQGENLLAVKVRSGRHGWVFVCGKPTAPITYSEDAEWKAPLVVNGNIKSGSALDLSAFDDAPAGKYGRLQISKTGDLVYAEKQGEPVRLLGFNGLPDGMFELEDDEVFREFVTRFAQNARRQGYRMFRVHGYLDRLSSGTPSDMQIDLKHLDRWDYLISELKKEGIYIHMVMFSFGLYASDYRSTYSNRDLHKLMMYLDGDWEFSRFRYAANYLFNHINPYTGVAWKDETSIAVVEYYNEQSIGIHRINGVLDKHPEVVRIVEKYWRAWLVERYGDDFPDEMRHLLNGEKPNNAGLPLNKESVLSGGFSLFWMDRAVVSARACDQIIREAGYPGLVTQYSYSKTMGTSAVRWETSQVVDVHSYFKHPSGWNTPYARVGQESSIEESASYWRSTNSTKLINRPFFVGEYNHSFWNPYRYEAGIVFAGYSALQGYGAICIHENPVQPDLTRLISGPFSAGSSPIARASQFVSACLFQRGDVKKSPNLVSLVIPQDYLNENGNAAKAVSGEQSKIALITGFSLDFPWLVPADDVPTVPAANIEILPTIASNVENYSWYTEVNDFGGSGKSLDEFVDKMKAHGILSASNLSKPSTGIFQSDTEEILLNSQRRQISVVTEQSVGVCLSSGNSAIVGEMAVLHSSVNGSIVLSSVDRNPISTSSRMVLTYATEEVNSNMELSPDRRRLISIGHAPLLLRVGTLTIEVRNSSEKLTCYALGLDGSRLQKIEIHSDSGMHRIHIDTSTLENGPSVFFELVNE